MKIDHYNQQHHDFVDHLRTRIAGTNDEQFAVRIVQEKLSGTFTDVSFDEVRDSLLMLAAGMLEADPKFVDEPRAMLAQVPEDKLYGALKGAIEYMRGKTREEGKGR